MGLPNVKGRKALQKALLFLAPYGVLQSMDHTPWLSPLYEIESRVRIDQPACRAPHSSGVPIVSAQVSSALSESEEMALLARSGAPSYSLQFEKQLSNDLSKDVVASSVFGAVGSALPWNIGGPRMSPLTLCAGARIGRHLWIERKQYLQAFASCGFFRAQSKTLGGFLHTGFQFGISSKQALRGDVWAWNSTHSQVGSMVSFMYSFTTDEGATWSIGSFMRRGISHTCRLFFTCSFSTPISL